MKRISEEALNVVVLLTTAVVCFVLLALLSDCEREPEPETWQPEDGPPPLHAEDELGGVMHDAQSQPAEPTP